MKHALELLQLDDDQKVWILLIVYFYHGNAICVATRWQASSGRENNCENVFRREVEEGSPSGMPVRFVHRELKPCLSLHVDDIKMDEEKLAIVLGPIASEGRLGGPSALTRTGLLGMRATRYFSRRTAICSNHLSQPGLQVRSLAKSIRLGTLPSWFYQMEEPAKNGPNAVANGRKKKTTKYVCLCIWSQLPFLRSLLQTKRIGHDWIIDMCSKFSRSACTWQEWDAPTSCGQSISLARDIAVWNRACGRKLGRLISCRGNKASEME